MTFDEWCDSKKINGNFREALFHSLAAKFDGVDKIPNDENIWEHEWGVVLSNIMSQLDEL